MMSDVSKMMRLEAENEQMQKELEDLKDVKQHFRNADIIASTLKVRTFGFQPVPLQCFFRRKSLSIFEKLEN